MLMERQASYKLDAPGLESQLTILESQSAKIYPSRAVQSTTLHLLHHLELETMDNQEAMNSEKHGRNERFPKNSTSTLHHSRAKYYSMGDILLPSKRQNNSNYENVITTAGIPIQELICKFEEERVIDRQDRLAVNKALLDVERRDYVINSLQDIELSTNSRFAVRRLKMLIHQNSSGMPAVNMLTPTRSENPLHFESSPTNKQQIETPATNYPLSVTPLPQKKLQPPILEILTNDSYNTFLPEKPPPLKSQGSDNKLETAKTPLSTTRRPRSHFDEPTYLTSQGGHSPPKISETITTLVGDAPIYYEPGCYGICSKISRRLNDFASSPSKGKNRKFAVLVGSGSCNPLTRMHMRSYYLAKQYLENQVGYVVLGSILSPSHGVTVRERYRNHPTEIIPSPHRLAVAQLMVESSKWLSVDPWEITRRRAMDYMSVLQHCRETLTERFPNIEIKIVYLCKENMVPKISPTAMREEHFGCISVCRPLECDRIRANLSKKWNGVIWIAEDTAILEASMDIVTSREVRNNIRENKPVKHLVGDQIDNYFKQHRIGAKMNGDNYWAEEELHLPKIASRRALPALKSAKDAYIRSELVQSIRNILAPTPGELGFPRVLGTAEGGGQGPSRTEMSEKSSVKCMLENDHLQYGELNMTQRQIRSYKSLGNIHNNLGNFHMKSQIQKPILR